MTRRRKIKYTGAESLPEDLWAKEPLVRLYRLEPGRTPQYLCTQIAFLVTESRVQESYGGGQYLFRVVHRGRVVRRGIFSIEGNPIRRLR